MSVDDDNALLDVVAIELNGGPLNSSHRSWHVRQKAAALIDAIEEAGFSIKRSAAILSANRDI